MDVLTLALLLFFLDGRADLKQTAEKFLAFYRENGPLFKALAASLQEGGKADPVPPKSPPGEKAEQKKDRPEEETVLTKVLEDYLKRRA